VAGIEFEWDESKASANRRRHGISFEGAQSAFYDEHALLIADPDHSASEERFVLLGLSGSLRILVVCHCYRQDFRIRIISARKANGRERKQYESR
jgi:uncharacterized DUF497 family protein